MARADRDVSLELGQLGQRLRRNSKFFDARPCACNRIVANNDDFSRAESDALHMVTISGHASQGDFFANSFSVGSPASIRFDSIASSNLACFPVTSNTT